MGAGFDGGGLGIVLETVAVAADGTGDVYVGGQFTYYDGTQVDHFAVLNPDGSLD